MRGTLAGREIVLAGGAGGLGAATARLLSEEGAKLIISYCRNAERARALESLGSVLQADLRLEADRRRLLDAAHQLYAVVVFAGDPARVRDPAQLEAAMRQALEVNYLGPILLAREAAERMRAQATEGAIVLFSTMQAVSVFAGSTAYAASKAALAHAARILAKESRKANIRVNVVAPGVMAAGMAQASIASGKYAHFLSDGVVSRFGDASDVARAVRFLLEPDNYITGQILCVDGGASL